MPDALAIWAYNVNGKLAGIDFGEVPARSSGDVMIRVKNQSSRYTAEGVALEFTAATDPAWQFYLSEDGVTFTARIELGDLAANGLTGAIWIRRVTPSDTTLGAKACRLAATATGWTQPDAA